MDVTAARRRMRREERREQLLTVAVELLVQRGIAGLTMEGLAAGAGVNKALAYQHFDNAQAVLSQIQLRHNRRLAARLIDAAQRETDLERRLDAVIAACFDVIAENQAVLPLLASPAAREAVEAAERLEPGLPWLEDFLVENFELPRTSAPATAEVVQGAVVGAANALSRGQPGSLLQPITVAACRAAFAAARSVTQ